MRGGPPAGSRGVKTDFTRFTGGVTCLRQQLQPMQKTFFLLGAVLLAAGCAGPEKKLARGLSNTFEVARWGELRRSVEREALFPTKGSTHMTGVIRGINRSLARTGLGLYEIATGPIGPYDPQFTNYLTPTPELPDNYRPRMVEDSNFATDTSIGFSGGEVFPLVPGSRFRIFDN